jgi:predicted amidohydrolase YtcJ
MKTLLTSLVLAVLLLPPGSSSQNAADTIFVNANVYTANDRQPKAEAVAVKGERIVFVGSSVAARRYAGKQTRIVDLAGKTVLPGMTDSHYHLIGVGERELTLNLEGITNLQDFLSKVKSHVETFKPGQWVTGRGWIETFWTPPVFPTRQDLDSVSPNNPVFLTRADGHGAVANSAALKLASIDKNTPDPFGGQILKDKQTREPTGMLLDHAQGLVRSRIPGPTQADVEKEILVGAERSIKLGWCEIQNAGSNISDIELLNKLYREGKLKLRIYNAAYGPGPAADKLLADGATVDAFDHRFTIRTIKVVFDGALGSRGAALLAPYSDADTSFVPDSVTDRSVAPPSDTNTSVAPSSDSGTSGFLTQKESELSPMLARALRAGIQVETHAIGDRANRVILDLYEKAFQEVPADQRKIREPRWRVEHAQIVNPADIPRFAMMGIIPSMQPSHAIGDLHFAPRRLGLDRLKGAYAWQSFIKSGVVVAGGSDAPVERGEPMIEFYAAVARKDLKGFSGEGWHLEEAVTREQALKMFTAWPAYAAFQENDKGSIEIGKLADLTVLSADVMKIPEQEIPKTRCLMTVIGGEIVFDDRPRQAMKRQAAANRLSASHKRS